VRLFLSLVTFSFYLTRPGHGAFDTISSDVQARSTRKKLASHLTIALSIVLSFTSRFIRDINSVANVTRVPRDDITSGSRPGHRRPPPASFNPVFLRRWHAREDRCIARRRLSGRTRTATHLASPLGLSPAHPRAARSDVQLTVPGHRRPRL